MKYLLDSHSHTIMSGHAYNTMQEMALAAKEKGLQALAITDHGPTIHGTCHPIYFTNFKVVDRFMYGIELLLGVELNIVDYQGNVDLPSNYLKRIDVGIASIHPNVGNGEQYPPYVPGDIKENTRAYLGAIENPDVDIIGHSGYVNCPYDYEKVARRAKELHKLIEINAKTLADRKENIGNCREIALTCKRLGTGISVGSDAHFSMSVGDLSKVYEFLSEIDFPEELIISRNYKTLKEYFAVRKEI